MKSLYITIFISALLLSASTIHAQTAAPISWKKRVARTIDMSEKEDTARHKLRNMGSDSLLVQMMVSAVQTGKLSAYNTWDALFSTKISQAELKERFASKIDTIIVVDPITGKEQIKLRKTDVNFEQLQKVRILEDWTYYPTSGTTQIQIIGVGPVQDVYGDAGDYRGQQIIFWLKYNEAKTIIDRYEQYHPGNTLSGHIWSDYFLSDVKPKEHK
jgi:hypothetical protein